MKYRLIIIFFILLILLSIISSANEIVGVVVVIAPTPTLSSGGSTSSGSGGITSDESYSNIASSCTIYKDFYYGKSNTLTFNCIIDTIIVSGTINEMDVKGRIEELKSKSNKTTQPEGEVYKYFNAYISTSRFTSVELHFKLPILWTTGKNIQVLRWKNDTWIPLETIKEGEDFAHSYFIAKTDHFSNFVIVGKSITPLVIPTVSPVLTPTPTPVLTPVVAQITISTPTQTIPTNVGAPIELDIKSIVINIIIGSFILFFLFIIYMIHRARKRNLQAYKERQEQLLNTEEVK